MSTTRERTRAFKPVPRRTRRIVRGGEISPGVDYIWQDVSSQLQDVTGTQRTVSDGHPFPPKPGSLTDVGGEFYTKKSYMASNMYLASREKDGRLWVPGGDWYAYYGPITSHVPTVLAGSGPVVVFPPSAETPAEAFKQLGATAVARCAPTNSVADAATFIGETMKDGLPSVVGSQTWRDRSLTARNAGSEYLNVQFGWRPLISDVSKLAHGVRHLDTVLAQYERDAGKVVRRRLNFPSVETTSEENLGPNYPFGIGNQAFDASAGDLIRRRNISIRQWFSGAFTYYLPSGYDSRNALSRYALMADLLGLKLTPDVLWNLAPWSWAVDWFSNTGDVLKNVSAYIGSGLIMRYGYLMEESIVTDTYTLKGHSFKTQSKAGVAQYRPKVLPSVYVTHVKKRIRANPYGFGVSWNDLSTFQLSILAALGISRGR